MKKGRKNCDEQLIEQISNTLENLFDINILSVVSSYEENDGISTFNLSNVS